MTPGTLLAQAGNAGLDQTLRGLSRGFNDVGDSAGTQLTSWIVASILLSALGLLGLYFLRRHQADRLAHGPALRQAGADLGLSRSEQCRLMRLAKAAGVANPCVLILSRGAFETAALSGGGPEDAGVSALRARVFG